MAAPPGAACAAQPVGPPSTPCGLCHVVPATEARLVALEQENHALRDQDRDLQHILQVKDSEIALKYSLLQAKERENAQTRVRIQWLEVSLQQLAEQKLLQAATSQASTVLPAGALGRDTLLRYNRALLVLDSFTEPQEFQQLITRRVDLDHPLSGPEPDVESQRRGQRTLKKGKPSEQALAPATPSKRKGRGDAVGQVWQVKGTSNESSAKSSPASPSAGKSSVTWPVTSPQANARIEVAESSPASTAKSSPSKRQVPPPLTVAVPEESGTSMGSAAPGVPPPAPPGWPSTPGLDATPVATPLSPVDHIAVVAAKHAATKEPGRQAAYEAAAIEARRLAEQLGGTAGPRPIASKPPGDLSDPRLSLAPTPPLPGMSLPASKAPSAVPPSAFCTVPVGPPPPGVPTLSTVPGGQFGLPSSPPPFHYPGVLALPRQAAAVPSPRPPAATAPGLLGLAGYLAPKI